ncbi:MAG: DUF3995 domain-containing protein [candidate division Zixibacteria bacterium]|jgi:hypothetical protein|nr:DUF3995 domain-containing protein [candidate division Zixibacteria bacterium]
MLAAILAVIDSVILIAAGILHVYWASGGAWGYPQSNGEFPEAGETLLGDPAFRRKRVIMRSIGLVCFIAAGLVLARVGIVTLPVQGRFVEYSLWALAGLFLLRALGDFRYTGLTRRVHGTVYARWDARLFTPLSLLLSITIFVLNLIAS